MNACASLGAVSRTGVSDDLEPMVFIDGSPEPRLRVSAYEADGPLDSRRAELYVDDEMISPSVIRHWLRADCVLALPVPMIDGEVRWPVLVSGALKRTDSDEAATRHDIGFVLVGSWEAALSLPQGDIWWINDSGVIESKDVGILNVGEKANRSTIRHNMSGDLIYLIEAGTGLIWTVSDALETISATCGLDLQLHGIPRDVMDAELAQSVDLSKPLSDVLSRILKPYDLVVTREASRSGGSIVEVRSIRPVSQGRRIRVVWADDQNTPGDALSIFSDHPTRAARQWMGRADGWIVESTFDMVRAWDPALEGQANDEYDKNLSSNFPLYADVYRRWVLNEDGYYSQPPYNRGPSYDLNAFFGVTGIATQTLPFEDNLTYTSEGNRLEPVVEISINGGTDWIITTMPFDVLSDRAGVYLDPTSLPSDFLLAAKIGLARVRVTAALTCPLPVVMSRWQGNAFTPPLPDKQIDVSDRFFFRRVDPQSIHYTGVTAGSLTADVVDHTRDMFRWLVEAMTRHDRSGDRLEGEAKLKLAGLWPLLRPGDRLLEVRGRGLAVNGQAQSLTELGGTIHNIKHDYASGSSTGRTATIDMTY